MSLRVTLIRIDRELFTFDFCLTMSPASAIFDRTRDKKRKEFISIPYFAFDNEMRHLFLRIHLVLPFAT